LIPEGIAWEASGLLREFCERRVPPAVRRKVWLEFKRRANAYTLIECRAGIIDPLNISRVPIAKFCYDEVEDIWELRYIDRNDRWHMYFEDVGETLEELIAEVDEDPTGIFWG